jgi:hypothetical protein
MYSKMLISTRVTLYVSWVTLQSVPDLRNNYVPECLVQIKFCTSQNWVHIWHKGVQLKSRLHNNGTWSDTAWLPTFSVSAQEYSSATFVSLCFHSHNEKYDARLKNIIISVFLSSLKLSKSEIA